MAIEAAPAISTPAVRQRTVLQSSSPVREVAVSLPSQSLISSRVVLVMFSTISGGTRAHVPSTGIWSQIQLGGSGGYARMGNLLASAWLSKPGAVVYSGGLFRCAGLVGLAPEYTTVVLFELTNTQNGTIQLAGSLWNESEALEISATAAASGQQARGVLAVGVAEGAHTFAASPTSHSVLTQTAASGFFSAPFSLVGAYKTQSSNDPMPVRLPYDGVSSKQGVLLFNAVTEDSGVTSLEGSHSATSVLAYPTQSITVDAYLLPGGTVSATTSAAVEFDPMTSITNTDARLNGTPAYSYLSESNLYSRISVSQTTDALTEQYHALLDVIDITLLGATTETTSSNAAIALAIDQTNTTNAYVLKDMGHSNDAYIFAGQSSHLVDAKLWNTWDFYHLTDSALAALGSLTHTTDAYLAATTPPSSTHTTDAYLLRNNIIAITGWELQSIDYESFVNSPLYGSPQISVTTSAKRTGSQGTHGLRMDNTTAGTDSYWVPRQNGNDLISAMGGVEEGTQCGAHYQEVWTTFYFRCNTFPTGGREQLLSDTLSQIGFDAITGNPLYGYPYWIGIGSTGSETPGYKLALYKSDINPSGGAMEVELASAYLNDSNWHLLEVRLVNYGASNLLNSSLLKPFTIDVYMDKTLVMSASIGIPCRAAQILGIQTRYTSANTQFDYDDFVISANRLAEFDLSVIAKPAKANGNYTAWTGTPADSYTDVDNIPTDSGQYQESSTVGQKLSVKVYSGGDTNPYPGKIHAVSFHAVHDFVTTASYARTLGLFVRQATTDLSLNSFSPDTARIGLQDRSMVYSRNPIDESLWENSIYDFEMGVEQLLSTATNRVLLLAANLLVSPTSLLHAADAGLTGEVNLTHTTDSSLGRLNDHSTDALMDAPYYKYHYTDAMLFSQANLTHLADAITAGEAEQSHTADAQTDRLLDQTVDATIVSVRGSVHDTDAALIGQAETSHDTDAIIWGLLDLPHDTDALQYRLEDIFASTDAFKLATNVAIHLANARMLGTISATHTTNALNRLAISGTQTTDALKHLRLDLTHFTTAAKLGEISSSYTSNSALGAINVVAQLHTASSTLKTSFTSTFSTDAFKKTTVDATGTTNSAVMGETGQIHTTNARLVNPTVVNLLHNTNSSIFGTVDSTHTTTSLLRQLYTTTHGTDAFTQFVGNLTQSTDALKFIQVNRTHTGDASLYVQNTTTHTGNSLLQVFGSSTHTFTVSVGGETGSSHTTNSIIFGEISSQHTTTGLLKKQTDLTTSTTSYLAFDQTHTTSSALSIPAEALTAVASSLFGSAQGTHTTNALMYVVVAATYTGDADLQGTVEVYHLSTSILFGTSNAVHTTNALAATEAGHTSESILFGETGSTISTSSMLMNNDLGIFEQNDLSPFEGAF